MTVYEARLDLARKNKKGISFILASVVLWTGILVIWLLPLANVVTRNFLTFFCAAPLLPIAFFVSKLIKAEFSVKDNPLNNLGILFSTNQFLYILIAMWAYAAAPQRMVMIFAMIFGAHLLPFAWLYQSRAYLVMAIVIPMVSLVVGVNLSEDHIFVIPALMLFLEMIFSVWLAWENKWLAQEAKITTTAEQ